MVRVTGWLADRRVGWRVGARLRAHLAVVLACIIGLLGLALGLVLPPGGPALAWFVPLIDGATILSLAVVGTLASVDVVVRQERSALPYVGIATGTATLLLPHMLTFPGVLPVEPFFIGTQQATLLFHLAHIGMPALLAWALLQTAGPLSIPRRAATLTAALGLMAALTAVGAGLWVAPLFPPLILNAHFTGFNRLLLVMAGLAVVGLAALFGRGHRGDPRLTRAVASVLILLGFQAVTELLAQAPYDGAWYAATALRLDPALLLMAGMLSLYGPSARAEREAEPRRRVLADLEALYKLTVDASPHAVITADDDGIITGWNPRAEVVFGWKEAEAVSHPLWTIVAAPVWRRPLRRRMRPTATTPVPPSLQVYQLTGRHRDGGEFPLELVLAARRGAAGGAVRVFFARELATAKTDAVLQDLRGAVVEPLAAWPTWADAAPHVLRGICERLQWDVGEFWVVDRKAEVLRLEHGWHRPGPELDRFADLRREITFARGSGLPGAVWLRGEPSWILDLRRDPIVGRTAMLANSGLHSGGAFAVRRGQDVVAVLTFFSRRRASLDRSRLGGLDGLARDLGNLVERKRAEESLRESGQRIRAVLDSILDGLVTFDEDGIVESFNPSAQRLFGYAPVEIAGRVLTLLIAESHRQDFLAYLKSTIRASNAPTGSGAYETLGRRKDGFTFPIEFSVNQVRLDTGRLCIGTLHDITQRKAQTQALEYRALHDGLTGLPNRTFLTDRLEQTLLAAEREGQPRGLLLLDLDRFKEVNDTLGHHQGDRVLQEVARRLRTVLRKADTIARLGGDEFAIVPAGVTDARRAILLAEKVLDVLEPPFHLDDSTIDVGASIGIAIYPQHGEDAAALTRHADSAMYVAKRARSGYSIFATENGTREHARL